MPLPINFKDGKIQLYQTEFKYYHDKTYLKYNLNI